MTVIDVAYWPIATFTAMPDVGRFRIEADMDRQARTAASVANDPQQMCVSVVY
jgi:hypothetical protein